MDLILAGRVMLCQIDLTRPIPIHLFLCTVPGQVVLSVLHAPDSELDLCMAVAGHVDHLDRQDIVVLYRRDGVILFGPTNDILCAAAVVAIRDFCLCTNAVICADGVIGELMSHGFFHINKYYIDEIFAIIPMDGVFPDIFIKTHRDFNNPSSVILFLALDPANIILAINLTPNGCFAIRIAVFTKRTQHYCDHAIFRINITLYKTVHMSVFVKIALSIAQSPNIAPASDHCAIICAVSIRFKVVGIVPDLRQAQSHLAVVVIVGLAVGLLDKAGMPADDQTVVKHERHLIDHLLAVIGHAVFIEAIVVLFHQEPAGLRDAAQEVHLAAGGFVTSPAGVVPLNGINGGMAVVAYQLAAAADGVRQLMALFGTAAGQRLEGQTVQKLLAAVSQNIIDVDRHLGLGRFHAQINRVEGGGRLCEDLAVIENVLAVD